MLSVQWVRKRGLFEVNRKQLPLVLMLIAGAITTLTVYFKGLGLKTMLIALLAALVAFGFIGSLIEYILNSFDRNETTSEVSDEGEVIEKEAVDQPVTEAQAPAAEETVE